MTHIPLIYATHDNMINLGIYKRYCRAVAFSGKIKVMKAELP